MHRINNVQLNQFFPGAKVYCKIKGCENFNLNTWSIVFGALYKMEINIVTWKWGGRTFPRGSESRQQSRRMTASLRNTGLRWRPSCVTSRGAEVTLPPHPRPCCHAWKSPMLVQKPQAAHLSIVQTVGLYKSSLRPYGRSYSHPALF